MESSEKALAIINGSSCALTTGNINDEKQTDELQRFIVHARDPTQADQPIFAISAAANSKYLTPNISHAESNSTAAVFNITNLGGVNGYTIQEMSSGRYLTFASGTTALSKNAEPIKLFTLCHVLTK